MAKNDFKFVYEIADSYEKSQISQSMFSEYIRQVTDRQNLTSELSDKINQRISLQTMRKFFKRLK